MPLGLSEDLRHEIFALNQCGLDGLGEDFLGAGVLHDAAAGFHDVEGVDRNVVAAGDHFCAQNRESGHAERPRQLVKQPGSVPGDHVDDGERAIEVILPLDDGMEGSDRVALVMDLSNWLTIRMWRAISPVSVWMKYRSGSRLKCAVISSWLMPGMFLLINSLKVICRRCELRVARVSRG